jgi:hypothetical protein
VPVTRRPDHRRRLDHVLGDRSGAGDRPDEASQFPRDGDGHEHAALAALVGEPAPGAAEPLLGFQEIAMTCPGWPC